MEGKEEWYPLDSINRWALACVEMISGEGDWIPLSWLTEEELTWFEINYDKREIRERSKPSVKKCIHGHSVIGANKGTRKGNGYSYCLACARGKSYCFYHQDADFEEVAQRYYEKAMKVDNA